MAQTRKIRGGKSRKQSGGWFPGMGRMPGVNWGGKKTRHHKKPKKMGKKTRHHKKAKKMSKKQSGGFGFLRPGDFGLQGVHVRL